MLTRLRCAACSFEAYGDRLISAAERSASVIVSVLPFVSETPLRSGLARSHDEFVQYEAAFNDLRCGGSVCVCSCVWRHCRVRSLSLSLCASTDGRTDGRG